MEINGFNLIETCGACPEQYDVMLGEKKVGYLRLRHGYFRADYPGCGGRTVYEAYPEGDGIFAGYEERMLHLTEAVNAIERALKGDSDE